MATRCECIEVKNSIVRFQTDQGQLVGNGVLVRDSRFEEHPGSMAVLTCTHVVLQALGLSEGQVGDASGRHVSGDFCFVEGRPRVLLAPVDLGKPSESDLAILKLTGSDGQELNWPAGVSAKALSPLVPVFPAGLLFSVIGIDSAAPDGRMGDGSVFAESLKPWRLALSLNLPTYPHGEPASAYCGSPILADNQTGPEVLGLWHGRWSGHKYANRLICEAICAK